MSAIGHRLLSLIIIVALTGAARAQQDLDREKSGAKLFDTNCATCHRSPRGLAKGRFSWTLMYFLQRHYTSNYASAQELTAYLQSADLPRAKPPPDTRKSRPKATQTSLPAPVPK
jgi:mono/diheme cytochrome c family protein